MKAITAYAPGELEATQVAWDELKSKVQGVPLNELFEDFYKRYGYAQYEFAGRVTDKFTDLIGHAPSADEIIMVVDNGFSHFGATCDIMPNGYFKGKVYID